MGQSHLPTGAGVVRPHLETQDLLAAHLPGPGPGLGSRGAVPMLLPHPLAWTEAPCQCLCPPVSGPLHLTSSHPGMPFLACPAGKLPLSAPGCLLRRRCDSPQRCTWFPKSGSLGPTEQAAVGGSYRGPGRWKKEVEAEEVETDQKLRLRSGWPLARLPQRLSASSLACVSGTVLNGMADGEWQGSAESGVLPQCER